MTQYRTIVADPPWSYPEGFAGYNRNPGVWSRRVERPLPFSAMSLDAIRALPIADLACRDCRLFLWTTQRYLPDAIAIIASWGFRYRQTIVWHKTASSPFGGSIAPNNAEFLLVSIKGAPSAGRWKDGCVVRASGNGGGETDGTRQIKHSRKPEVFLDLVETVSPGPYLELFARRQRLGWDTWGDQAFEHVDVRGGCICDSGMPHERTCPYAEAPA